jgi:hypothetical protein
LASEAVASSATAVNAPAIASDRAPGGRMSNGTVPKDEGVPQTSRPDIRSNVQLGLSDCCANASLVAAMPPSTSNNFVDRDRFIGPPAVDGRGAGLRHLR